jgi:MFS family permease
MDCVETDESVSFGYDTGQISGFLEQPDFLRRFGQKNSQGEYYFSDVRSGLIVALLSIGTLIGALIAAPIADRIGRKYSISFWCVVCAVGKYERIPISTSIPTDIGPKASSCRYLLVCLDPSHIVDSD